MSLNDPEHVREEYASEAGLLGRRAAYRWATGPDALEVLFETIESSQPRVLLEVGCGPGELAERIQRELGASVVPLDISPRMVELARERGVDARLGDVQELPFDDGSFDCVVAAWMLYHVPDVDCALGELARVLRPGGGLVAVTNYLDHLQELRALATGFPRPESAFSGDNGRELLARHFATIEERDVGGTIHFPDRDAVVSYLRASITLKGAEARLPDFDPPFVVRRHPTIFVAHKA
ncbi:MAG TPA: class I SAM-dependent methyltransferase [Gaiellaceae bacterium]|nr:class I SAM-dependent methyltransferase [Gaiellaceae bacterium]